MNASGASVEVLLRSLKLPGFVHARSEVAEQAEREGWGFERYLQQLAEIEIEERRVRRIERLRKRSGLPHDKTRLRRASREHPGFRSPGTWQESPRLGDRPRARRTGDRCALPPGFQARPQTPDRQTGA